MLLIKKLRIKFICVNMVLVVLMLGVIFALVIGFTQRNMERESMSLLRSAVSGGESGPRRFGPGPGGRDRDQTALLPPYIRVELAENGAIVHAEGFVNAGGREGAADLAELVKAALESGAESGVLDDWGFRYLRVQSPLGLRLAFVDISDDLGTMRGLIRTCALIGTVSLVVFFFVSLLLSRWAVGPVASAWRRQKRFVSDASHELKTPLTVVMTNAELLQSPDYDALAKARFSENILTMARQMRGLVEGLLELARMDGGAAETGAAELDFSRLCTDAALPFEPLCFEKGLTLSSGIAEGVRLRGNGGCLRQVIEILLDNAQKYADAGSEITVTLKPEGRNCRLCVANRGAPISDEDMPHLFERFYRADKSRGRDGGYGLGLAIAQGIVESHHGRIWAESRDGLNRFVVLLPML